LSRSSPCVYNPYVHAAARQIRRLLTVQNGGRLPRTVAGWERLCAALGVPVSALWACPMGFSARVFCDERLRGGWLIVYNPRRGERQARRFLCHEIAEWLAAVNYPSLFDELPSTTYYYTGGSDPDDARHRIAKAVEELCFRRR
jgi:hypothetical protein